MKLQVFSVKRILIWHLNYNVSILYQNFRTNIIFIFYINYITIFYIKYYLIIENCYTECFIIIVVPINGWFNL